MVFLFRYRFKWYMLLNTFVVFGACDAVRSRQSSQVSDVEFAKFINADSLRVSAPVTTDEMKTEPTAMVHSKCFATVKALGCSSVSHAHAPLLVTYHVCDEFKNSVTARPVVGECLRHPVVRQNSWVIIPTHRGHVEELMGNAQRQLGIWQLNLPCLALNRHRQLVHLRKRPIHWQQELLRAILRS